DLLSIEGSDLLSIEGSDLRSIEGSDLLSIEGSDLLSIEGSDLLSIEGSDLLSIEGSDLLSIEGSDLLVIGTVDVVGADFVSVLGQTIFADSQALAGISPGSSVAIYGSLDEELGGIVDASIVPIAAVDSSFLRGVVDEVNTSIGTAVVSGVTVDYTALLSNGSAPSVGEVVSVRGRTYGGIKLLVAER
ncbi:MAG: hypothetical protein OEY04_15430, partial [Gammaproteobacteria bacterium]|nr:hypothetical protein [Gammaproteobacteria bacterium]